MRKAARTGRHGGKMFTKRSFTDETGLFLFAPTFYVYILGIAIVIFAVFLPEINAQGALEFTGAGNSAGFAYARLFASEIGEIVLFLPAFAVAASVVRDKERRKRGLSDTREGLSSRGAVLVRFISQGMLLCVPVIIAGSCMFAYKAGTAGAFAFVELAFFWLCPAILFETALVLCLNEWPGFSLPGILASLVIWVFSQGSTADVGDYDSCIAIRHASLEGYQEYLAGVNILTINRIAVLVLAGVLVFLAVLGNEFRRKKDKKA